MADEKSDWLWTEHLAAIREWVEQIAGRELTPDERTQLDAMIDEAAVAGEIS